MSTIFIVFKNNFKRAFNEKGKFFINFLIPVVAIVLAIFVNYLSTPSINIGVVSKKDFAEQKRMVSLMKQTKGINIKAADISTIKTDTILGKYDGVITFKKQFAKGEVKNIDDYFDFYTVKDKRINSAMKGIVKAYLYTDKSINMKELSKTMDDNTLSKTTRILSFLAMTLFITCTVNAAVIIRDKSENTFCRFMYSPNRNIQYILGNVMYNYVFTYIQLVLSLLLIKLFVITLSISYGTLLSFGLVLVLLATTFGTFMTCIFTKELYANLFSSAISMILSLIGGSFIVYSKMPHGLQVLSSINPIRWVIKASDYLQRGSADSLNPVIALLAFSIVFALVSAVINKISKN